MAELRSDIFPGLEDSLLCTRDGHLQTLVRETRKTYPNTFSSDDEVIEFVNNLYEPKIAELFFDVSEYFLVARDYVKESFVKLIMIFSVIERITTKFTHYHNWIRKRENKDLDKIIQDFLDANKLSVNATQGFLERVLRIIRGDNKISVNTIRELLKTIESKHNDTVSATKRVFEFLDKHLSNDEKFFLISSFRTKRTKFVSGFNLDHLPKGNRPKTLSELSDSRYPLMERILPRCYSWRECWIEGNCYRGMCPLMKDKERIKVELKYVVRIMYNFRSKFVHETKIPPLTDSSMPVYDVYDNKPIVVELDMNQLFTIMENSIIQHFKDL